MRRYFGTDGVRGVANYELTAELAYKLGRAGAYTITKESNKPIILIGRDTRISGEMIEHAVVAGILSMGANVIKLGVITTPAVAYLIKKLGANAGIMISASHNPFQDNGIKFFGADGFKLSDRIESEIEIFIDMEEDELPRPTGRDIGRVEENNNFKQLYVDFLKESISTRFDNIRIIMDTANGAAYELAPRVFRELGAEVIAINNQPNGININDKCGSTHPEGLIKVVLETKADLGVAYDGDADRLIVIDDKGQVLDGDQIMIICGKYLHEKERLNNNTIVSTVMSNMGFYKALDKIGLNSVKTKVGDRYVVEAMKENGYNLGGEQSGHIIFLDYNTTGDGVLSSIQLVNVIKEKGLPLSELAKTMIRYPQILENIYISDREKYNNNSRIEQKIEEVQAKLGDEGRVLVRLSGTEPLIRVMAEGTDITLLKTYINEIVDVIKMELS